MTDHQLLLVLAEILVLVAAARVGGEIAARLGIPIVVGEIVFGIMLGPSLFGQVWPGGFRALFPPDPGQRDLLELVGWIGVLFLVVSAGLETRLGVLRAHGRAVMFGWLGAFLVPFAAGWGFGLLAPDILVGPEADRTTFALFIGVAMSISAIPVIARILMDLNLIRTRLGVLIMSTAVADDTIGWLVLGVVAGLARGEGLALGNLAWTLTVTGAFVVFAFTAGRDLLRWALRSSRSLRIAHAEVTVVLGFVLLGALATQAIGVHLALGAFIVAIQLRRTGLSLKRSENVVTQIGSGFFTPFFFAFTGINVDLTTMRGSTLVATIVAVAIACIAKFVGGAFGARAGGLPKWEAIATGIGLNARGAIGLVIAAIGLSIGVITEEAYTMLVMVSVVTTLMTAPLLRLCVKRISFADAPPSAASTADLDPATP
ncbi:MAG: cation:proton antiporter [Actinomycetota bacterium]